MSSLSSCVLVPCSRTQQNVSGVSKNASNNYSYLYGDLYVPKSVPLWPIRIDRAKTRWQMIPVQWMKRKTTNVLVPAKTRRSQINLHCPCEETICSHPLPHLHHRTNSYPQWVHSEEFVVIGMLSRLVRVIARHILTYFIRFVMQWHKWAVTWNFQQFGMYDKQSLRSACAYAQSDQSLC